ncbi:16S rRNA (guanine(527)-N(7))-methyltransferase RsmG [Acidocella sp.]|uniref:16S rRNA (guanine(527)-N(7))-methyltransferase RsmG n=1 Tax=Acidocella sp. TaxID=50710 RepID=UPI0026241E61|nr:16S rRNA (guanine(527)-N(7))-methyltransferase RsmG [Acidocella sp.]
MQDPKLRLFADLVAKWSPRINLISKSDLPHLWARHIEDSLRLLPFLPPNLDRAIDLGSGAGFPGLVVCIATGIKFELIESDARKAAFLLEAARQTGAPAKIHNCRIEAAKLDPARLITARALAPLDKLLGLAAPLLTEDGFCLFPKGRTAPDELTAATRLWHMSYERLASSDDESCILKLSEIRHASPL